MYFYFDSASASAIAFVCFPHYLYTRYLLAREFGESPAQPMRPYHRAPLYLSAVSVRPTVSDCVRGEGRGPGTDECANMHY